MPPLKKNKMRWQPSRVICGIALFWGFWGFWGPNPWKRGVIGHCHGLAWAYPYCRIRRSITNLVVESRFGNCKIVFLHNFVFNWRNALLWYGAHCHSPLFFAKSVKGVLNRQINGCAADGSWQNPKQDGHILCPGVCTNLTQLCSFHQWCSFQLGSLVVWYDPV